MCFASRSAQLHTFSFGRNAVVLPTKIASNRNDAKVWVRRNVFGVRVYGRFAPRPCGENIYGRIAYVAKCPYMGRNVYEPNCQRGENS